MRDWYKNAELTPQAQKRFAFKTCCDHADVVKTLLTAGAAELQRYLGWQVDTRRAKPRTTSRLVSSRALRGSGIR